MTRDRICIVGLGYIGLPTAAVFASRGATVIGVDTNQSVVDTINRGEVHIVEPHLDIVLRGVVNSGNLKADIQPDGADAFIIAVPTPFKSDHEPDLSYVHNASKSIAPFIKHNDLVILESTSPVGTTEKVCEWLATERPDLTFPHTHGDEADVRVAHCPERVLPGNVLRELVENDRIIGGISSKCTHEAIDLYKQIVQGQCIATQARLAEMTKLAENAFRDVNIAFANEMSMICDQLNLDVWELIQLANRHPRVNILQPGSGVGGHCIAVDPWFIISSAPEKADLIRSARETNSKKPLFVIEKVLARAEEENWSKVGCLGLSFKPNVDDMRESPALEIVSQLARNASMELLIVEPFTSSLPDLILNRPNVVLVSLEDAIKEADGLVGLVRHDLFVSHFNKHPDSRLVDFVNLG